MLCRSNQFIEQFLHKSSKALGVIIFLLIITILILFVLSHLHSSLWAGFSWQDGLHTGIPHLIIIMIIITSIITSIINQNHHLTSITLYKEAEAGAGERGRKDYHHCYQHSPVLSPVISTLTIVITSIINIHHYYHQHYYFVQGSRGGCRGARQEGQTGEDTRDGPAKIALRRSPWWSQWSRWLRWSRW